MDRQAPIRYADAGGVSIAYRVMGEGPLDVVWVPGFISNLEVDLEGPAFVRLCSRSRCRCTYMLVTANSCQLPGTPLSW